MLLFEGGRRRKKNQETENYVETDALWSTGKVFFFPWSVSVFSKLCSPCFSVRYSEVAINSRGEKKKKKRKMKSNIFWIDCAVQNVLEEQKLPASSSKKNTVKHFFFSTSQRTFLFLPSKKPILEKTLEQPSKKKSFEYNFFLSFFGSSTELLLQLLLRSKNLIYGNNLVF